MGGDGNYRPRQTRTHTTAKGTNQDTKPHNNQVCLLEGQTWTSDNQTNEKLWSSREHSLPFCVSSCLVGGVVQRGGRGLWKGVLVLQEGCEFVEELFAQRKCPSWSPGRRRLPDGAFFTPLLVSGHAGSLELVSHGFRHSLGVALYLRQLSYS